ncbi:MAG: flagellar basal body P-ring protein FlgI [Synergistaceae bacterium]|nr:flagellar basal body P-ring protein FlgI [Synergistaceae bacterium]
MAKIRALAALILALLWPLPLWAAGISPQVRLKDLASIEGARSNQLVGMGLVVGLQGTGDRGDLVLRMMQNMVNQFGIAIDADGLRSRNAAVVSVTVDLPPFARPGQAIDARVSAMGDAKSLEGGVLLQTPLRAANGAVYAAVQGPVLVGGFSAGGQAASVEKNVTTTGRIAGGVLVEREVPTGFTGPGGTISLLLNQPDFTTARRMADAVNGRFGAVARPSDAGRVEVSLPPAYASNPSVFVAELEALSVQPDMVARVVVNERTGTVVMGGNVRIGTVAVAHGNLTVQVVEQPEVVQPQPFGQGQTAVVPRTGVAAQEGGGQLVTVPQAGTVDELVEALNGVGASPRDMIAILQAIDRAGALHGRLEVM